MLRTLCLLAVLAACGSVKHTPREDAGLPSDAKIDVPPTPGRGILSGAGRLTGATYTLDVEIGHQVGQQPTTGATYRMEGNAAIKP